MNLKLTVMNFSLDCNFDLVYYFDYRENLPFFLLAYLKYEITWTENGDVVDVSDRLWTLFERKYLWKETINQVFEFYKRMKTKSKITKRRI